MDTYTLRRLSVEHQVDPRTILKEQKSPGSVTGMAGHRARAALAAVGSHESQSVSAAPEARVG
jgi:hypothetical protein